jgi:C-terminal processing protease CtpA/Prc
MKKIVLFLLVVFSQNLLAETKITETQKLATTCKVWGFLKYYHPKVADGSKNWDEQLFIILPQIEKAQTKEEFSLVLENWIDALGEVKKIAPILSPKDIDYFDKNFDLSWIDKNKLFSKNLSKKLRFIENNRIQNKQYYFSSNPYVSVTNEINYPNFKWTDKNLRLLTFFRYWNYVEYFFPYKYQMDQKWDLTLEEMMPRFNSCESELDFHLAFKELTVKLNDTHATFGTGKMFEKFGNKFIPAVVKIIDEKAVITSLHNDSLAKISDIKVGDAITKVDEKTISQLIKENRKYVEGSNEPAKFRNIYWAIFNGKTDSLKIEFIRNGKVAVKTIRRYPYQDLKIKQKEKETFKILENNIGYIDIENLKIIDLPIIFSQLKDSKAIVIDLRYYPQEDDIESALAEYLNFEEKEAAKLIDPDLNYPSRYIWRETQKCGKTNPNNYKGKVVLLVNEHTQSHGEHTAMVLQTAPIATIIGSQTAGADGGAFQIEVIKGIRTQLTGYGMFYPNKKETQRIGIIPDIEVKQTIKGIQEGKDEVLDEAIRFINK